MTPEERQALIEAIRHVAQLFDDRNDIIIGVTAALLDLYRLGFENGQDTKEAAVVRLQAHLDFLRQNSPGQRGALYLNSLLQTLVEDKLDAARLIREAPHGTA